MDNFDDNVKNAYYCKIVDFVNTFNNKQCTNVCYIKGKLFEYIAAIYFKSRLYDNISTDYKEQFNLPNNDCDSNSAGVDIIDTANNKIIQCKYYQQKTLYKYNIANFVITLLNLYNKFTGILAVNENIKLAKNLNNNTINNCSIEKIPDNIYNQIINDAFDYVKHDTIDNTTITHNIILRDYQQEVLQLIDSHDKYKFKLPCGTGKSFIIAEYINKHPHLKCIVLTPSVNLANDMCNLIHFEVNKLFSSNSSSIQYNSSVAVYNTAFNKYIANNNFLTDYDCCFIDEAHHYYNNAFNMKSIKTKRLYLFSATLKQEINDIFPFFEYSYKDAIMNNYILDFNMNVHYVKDINYNTAVHILKKYIQYQHVIIYCNRIEDCKQLTDLLTKNNISAQYIAADKQDSYQIIQDFRNNKFRCIVNCNMINEGIDIKNCETAFFFDNTFSYNRIIQCVGRTQRCFKNKLNGNFVIMVNDENKDNLVNRYLNVLAETNTNYIDSTKYKLNFYNDYHIDKIEENSLEEEEDSFEEEFIEFEHYVYESVYSKDHRIEICKEFYNEYKRLPKTIEKYKDFKIGNFISGLKYGCNSHLKEEVESIFNTKIEANHIDLKDDNEKLELCKSFYNEYKRLPKRNESYKDFNIGSFITNLKKSQNSHLKEEVENIFNTKIEVNRKLNLKDDNEKIELCKEFYNEYKRLPKRNESYKDFNIGSFITNLKKSQNSYLKEEVENIFNTKIEVTKKLNLKDDNEKLELCREFYNEYKRLPKDKEKYKDFNIGNFINGLKQGKNSYLKEEVENIFNTKIEVNRKLNLKNNNEKIELCKEFYNEYKRIPKQNESYKDFNIGNFINGLKQGKNSHLKEEVENIFNTKIEVNHYIDDNEKIELCKEFYNIYKRLPTSRDKYKNFNIGSFIKDLKRGHNSHLKEEVENIFNTKI